MKNFKNTEYNKIKHIIITALKEDLEGGDITTNTLISKNKKIKAVILVREKAVVSGIEIAKMVFKTLDNNVHIKSFSKDGDKIKASTEIMQIEGNARAILTGERTALNFLSHLSGIATQTAEFVHKIKPYKTRILDTRKTTPGLRVLEKYAVRSGGGFNHRMGLWDMVLIKDNHIKIINSKFEIRNSKQIPNPKTQNPKLKDIIERVRKKIPKATEIEIEVENLKEFKEAISAKPDIIMLDNMRLSDIKKSIVIRRKMHGAKPKTLLEVSGNVTLANVRTIAKTGVDMISIGSLTHSVKAIDMALDIK